MIRAFHTIRHPNIIKYVFFEISPNPKSSSLDNFNLDSVKKYGPKIDRKAVFI